MRRNIQFVRAYNSRGTYDGKRAIQVGDIKPSNKGGYHAQFILPGSATPQLVRFLSMSDVIEAPDMQDGIPVDIEDSIAEDNYLSQPDEPDDVVMARIEDRFETLQELSDGLVDAKIRGLIISGPQGIGKTETITRTFERREQDTDFRYHFVKGKIATGGFQFYKLLFEHQDPDQVLVMDDSDGLLYSPNDLNLLKAALETGNRPRIVSYHSQSIENIGLPTSFEYKGRMAFITNINFSSIIKKDKAIGKHLAAFIDRSIYLDLTLHGRRETWLRIKSMIFKHNLLREYNLSGTQTDELVAYMETNRERFTSLSLRTANMIASFMNINYKTWRRTSDSCLFDQSI